MVFPGTSKGSPTYKTPAPWRRIRQDSPSLASETQPDRMLHSPHDSRQRPESFVLIQDRHSDNVVDSLILAVCPVCCYQMLHVRCQQCCLMRRVNLRHCAEHMCTRFHLQGCCSTCARPLSYQGLSESSIHLVTRFRNRGTHFGGMRVFFAACTACPEAASRALSFFAGGLRRCNTISPITTSLTPFTTFPTSPPLPRSFTTASRPPKQIDELIRDAKHTDFPQRLPSYYHHITTFREHDEGQRNPDWPHERSTLECICQSGFLHSISLPVVVTIRALPSIGRINGTPGTPAWTSSNAIKIVLIP